MRPTLRRIGSEGRGSALRRFAPMAAALLDSGRARRDTEAGTALGRPRRLEERPDAAALAYRYDQFRATA